MIDNSVQGTFKILNPDGTIKLDSEGNEIKIRGKKNVKTYFSEHKDEWKALYDNVYTKIKIKESPYIKSFEELLNSDTERIFGEEVMTSIINSNGEI